MSELEPPAPANQEPAFSSTGDLVKALQAFVLEVSKGAPPTEKAQKPTRVDAFWMLLLVCDFALFLWWLPTTVLTSEKVAAFREFVPWIGSGAYILGYTWFRDRILSWSQHLWFKCCQGAVLLVLSILLFVAISININVQPAEAKVWLDGKPLSEGGQNGHWTVPLKLATHQFRIGTGNSTDGARTIDFHWSRVLLTVLTGNRKCFWSAIYPVNFFSQTNGYTITIERDKGNPQMEFDPDFLHDYVDSQQLRPLEGREQQLQHSLPSSDYDATLNLPPGTYTFTATKEHCGTQAKYGEVVAPPKVTIKFGKLCP